MRTKSSRHSRLHRGIHFFRDRNKKFTSSKFFFDAKSETSKVQNGGASRMNSLKKSSEKFFHGDANSSGEIVHNLFEKILQSSFSGTKQDSFFHGKKPFWRNRPNFRWLKSELASPHRQAKTSVYASYCRLIGDRAAWLWLGASLIYITNPRQKKKKKERHYAIT